MIQVADHSQNETVAPYNRESSAKVSLIVAVNNDRVLNTTLLASPGVNDHCQIILKRGFRSAGSAYNSGLSEANEEILVFAHQDVFLPTAWFEDLERAVKRVAAADPNWGVLGVFGVTRSSPADYRGYCYSTGLQAILGDHFEEPMEAQSLDELVLVIRHSSGLSFDEHLPGFHLYGTDICLRAKQLGKKSYIIPAFCLHNSNGVARLPKDFWSAYFYLRRTWWQTLPVVTCCTTLSRHAMPAIKSIVRDLLAPVFPARTPGHRVDDVVKLYDSLAQQLRHR